MAAEEKPQICYRCKVEKPLAAFTRRVDDRHYNMCRACVSEILLPRWGKKERLTHTGAVSSGGEDFLSLTSAANAGGRRRLTEMITEDSAVGL